MHPIHAGVCTNIARRLEQQDEEEHVRIRLHIILQ